MTISVRGTTALVYVNNTNTGTINLPTGSVAGDLCVLFAAHGYQVNTPTNWTVIYTSNVSNFNGATFIKVLTASDISTGNVTVTFSGTSYGQIGIITFVGSLAGVLNPRSYTATAPGSGAASRVVTTDAYPLSTDYIICFGANRATDNVTSSLGTSLQTNNQANASAALYGQLAGSGGAQSTTISYSVTGIGDYAIILAITETPITTYFNTNMSTDMTIADLYSAAIATAQGGVATNSSFRNRYLYWEIKPTTITGGTAGIGIYAPYGAEVPINYQTPWSEYRTAALTPSGTWIVNNTTVATIFTYTNTDTIGVAVDTGLNLIWFTKNGTTWNNDVIGNQNPVGSIGGLSFGGMSLTKKYAWVGATASGPVFVGQFSSTSWSYSAPTGYVSLDNTPSVSGATAADIGSAGLSWPKEGRASPVAIPTIAQARFPDSWSDKSNTTKVSGNVYEAGNPTGKTVYVYQVGTGALVSTTTSNASNGYWYGNTGGISSNVFAVCVDPPNYNALVSDNITPG